MLNDFTPLRGYPSIHIGSKVFSLPQKPPTLLADNFFWLCEEEELTPHVHNQVTEGTGSRSGQNTSEMLPNEPILWDLAFYTGLHFALYWFHPYFPHHGNHRALHKYTTALWLEWKHSISILFISKTSTMYILTMVPVLLIWTQDETEKPIQTKQCKQYLPEEISFFYLLSDVNWLFSLHIHYCGWRWHCESREI